MIVKEYLMDTKEHNNICTCNICPFESFIPAIVDKILKSYKKIPKIHYLDRRFLPSRYEVIEILDLTFPILYPGYHGRQDLTFNNVSYHVGELTTKLSHKLCTQIYNAIAYKREAEGSEVNPDICRREAIDKTMQFLNKIPSLREFLEGDVQAAYDGDPAAVNTDEVLLAYPGLFAITVYRIAHELYLLDVPLIPRIMTEYAHSLTGIDIHPGAKIGKNFFIDHGTGVVIGETTEIGDNVKIYQGVTLGALSFPRDERGKIIRGQKRHPTIEDDVTIYANATILGGNTVIGKGAVIGGNVFITSSVPPYSKVTIKLPELSVKDNIKKEKAEQGKRV